MKENSASHHVFDSNIEAQCTGKSIQSFVNTRNREREYVDNCNEESSVENISDDFFKELKIDGRRIVDVSYFLKQFVDVCRADNSELCCNLQLSPVKCRDEGLGANILIKCDNCNFKKWIASEPREKR